jgi:hypothetical protein
MIVSHRHRFVFIKTLKTAGSSIETLLASLCGPEDVVTPIFPPVEGHAARNHRGLFNPAAGAASLSELRGNLADLRTRRKFFNHIDALRTRARLGQGVWRDYLTFCFERNPWDKTLSHFHMFRRAKWHARYDPNLTLDQYLSNGVFCRNAPFYCDRDGTVMVDRVLRYERLEEDLEQVFDELRLPFPGLAARAKSDLRPDRRPYREVLESEQAARIEAAFADEIRLHGWTY